MTDPLFDEDDEANTPLTEEEREQLIPTYITLRSELNEAEQINITEANRWFTRKRNADILDDALLKELHKHMFGQVWKWAGKYRRSPRNIGIDAYLIPTEMRQLVDNVRFWTENKTYPPDEIAVRFSHQLVSIHPFPNGNVRHSRMAGDYLAVQLGQPPFTWGRTSLTDASETRKTYIAALKAADREDIQPLLKYARN
jgi:Fic-DOC domain mobile mystery protein B